eukprot:TRINITY_DN5090_c0_g1_i1.p1 TRINITY_DN5090_c0_g1~~TRINITY_DN5090_c0_g1_i1.p1  ORF type:complete len:217 (-),score=53.79 TRINITY_DN5090_c0_g1_i1:285-935(-)
MPKGELRLSNDKLEKSKTVTGQVSLHFKKPVRLHKLRVVLVGREKTHWTEGSGESQRSYYSFNNFLNLPLDIWVSEEGEEGCHFEQPFQFQLPNELLPSYSFPQGKIYYSFRALGDWKKVSKSEKRKSRKSSKKEQKDACRRFHKIPFTVLPTPHNFETFAAPILLTKEKKMSGIFGQKQGLIEVKGKLDKTVYKPGESIDVTVYLKNQAARKFTH